MGILHMEQEAMRDKGERGGEVDGKAQWGETVAVGVCGCSASKGECSR